MNLVTGKKSNAHVSSDDFRKIVESLVGGGGSFVSSVGTELQTSVSGTTLSIGKGMIVHHGCVFETSNSGDTVSFQAGSSGMNRIDLICVKYTRNNTTGIEDAAWNVLQGTATSGTPAQPTVPSGDLRDDNATQDYCPVFKLTLNGNTPTVQLLLNTIPIDDAYHKPSTGIPKAHLSSAVQSSLNLADSAIQFDLLWQNASQSSEFSSQTISASLSSYSHCGVVIGGSGMKILKVGESGEALTSYGLSASNINGGLTKREFSTTTTGVSFQNAYCKTFDSPMSPFTNNSALVPRYIFGIKNIPTSV